MNFKKELVVLGCAVIGAGFGFADQNGNRNDARARANTVEACTQSIGYSKVVNAALAQCLEKGTPGGKAVGSGDVYVGEPIPILDSYHESQQQVADSIDAGTIVKGAAIGAVVGIIL